jgi:hypothetical protein
MVPSCGTLERSWDDPGTLGITRQDTVTSRLGFYRFLVDLGDPFREIVGFIWTETYDFFLFIFRLLFFMIWVLNLGVWDRKIKHLARKVLQKSILVEIGFLMFPGTIFHDFGWPWDQFS